ncbi:MAG: hypothetical protein JXO22_15180, partial [Phycisphaerae bacterium]|nr:hypothetical protein [Phycisphaerae bacterium]
MPDGTTNNIQRIIDTYEPPLVPDDGELPPIVVAINPIGGGNTDPAQRTRDNLAMMAGAHLYHMVRRAGAAAIMTRADDQPPLPLAEFCEEHAATLAVSILFEDEAKARVDAQSEDTLSASLARHMAESMSARHDAEEPRASARTVLRIPAAMVCFSYRAIETSPTLPREHALRIYHGIVAFVREHEDALRVTHGHRRCIPHLPSQTWDEQIVSAARRIWPDDDLPLDKAPWFAGMFRAAILHDRSMVHFEPRITVAGDTVVIGGATSIELLVGTLRDALLSVGVERVTNEMRLLPRQGRLDGPPFGICAATSALTYDAPTADAGVQSQILRGEPLWLLDRDSGHYLAHAADGYCGWVRETAVRAVAEDEFDTSVTTASGKSYPSVFAAALDLLNRPYVFGGIAPIGLDCSGLV